MPFDERYSITGELLRELIHCFEDAGLNGEFSYLSFEEKFEVVMKKYSRISTIKVAIELRDWNVGRPTLPSMPLQKDAVKDIRKNPHESGSALTLL